MTNPPVSNGLTVTVAYAAHGVEALVTLALPGGATIDDAIAAIDKQVSAQIQ